VLLSYDKVGGQVSKEERKMNEIQKQVDLGVAIYVKLSTDVIYMYTRAT